jgi:predicted transcriptional regulator
MSDTITVRIPKDLKEKLESICKKEKISMSDLIRKSISKNIVLYQFRKLRNQVLPFAEAQGLLTDEDIFKEIS